MPVEHLQDWPLHFGNEAVKGGIRSDHASPK